MLGWCWLSDDGCNHMLDSGLINAWGSSEKFRIWLKLPKQLFRPFNYFNYATSNFLSSPAAVLPEQKDEDVGFFTSKLILICQLWNVGKMQLLAGGSSGSENFSLNLLTRQISHRLPTLPMHAWHLSLPLINRWKLPASRKNPKSSLFDYTFMLLACR